MPTDRSMLVITNSGAGTADQEALDAALAVLRGAAEVEVAATSSPEEARGGPARRGRAGGRRRGR
ncbi:hypothetical protein [Nocardioides convexus]|uniref:hypothetical protein n=1 Tax=Nocardioides convexus TaxID=2712224 RepID=UPI0024181961|nr:hypothetical protein [Nocardioides convexus]